MIVPPIPKDNSPPIGLGPLQPASRNALFIEKVEIDPSTGCWLWTGHVAKSGYGQFQALSLKKGVICVQYAHRVSFESVYGPISSGLDLDHLCRCRRCVNPSHLEAVTRKENLLRGDTSVAAFAARTHCDKGHPLSGENLYFNPAGRGRSCRKCKQELYRAWAKNNRERRRALDREHYHTKRKFKTTRRGRESQEV